MFLKQANNNIFSAIFLFLFPFYAGIIAIKNFTKKYTRYIFWYTCSFMGILHIYNPLGGGSADGIRYAQSLLNMQLNNGSLNSVIEMFQKDGGVLDIYQPLITFLVSLFTYNPHILFLVFAIVFGFFYSQNIWLVLESKQSSKQVKWWIWIIIVMFILINPIWNINGVRMYTALHVFIYGLFSFYLGNKKSRLIWLFLSPFFHFSFVLPVLIFLIFYFLPKKNLSVYFTIYFICVLFNEIDIQAVKDWLFNVLPVNYLNKIDGYLNEDYITNLKESRNQYAAYILISNKISKYFILIVLSIFWLNSKTLFKTQSNRMLLILFLLLGSFTELFSSIPSLERFKMIESFIFYAVFLLILLNSEFADHKIHKLTSYITPILILPLLFNIRKGFDYYGLSLFYGNFISAGFMEDRLPLIDIVKYIL